VAQRHPAALRWDRGQPARGAPAVTRGAWRARAEARTLFQISRELVTGIHTRRAPNRRRNAALETGMKRVWVSLGTDDALERVARTQRPENARSCRPCSSSSAGCPAMNRRWVRVHQPNVGFAEAAQAFRVRIAAARDRVDLGLRDRSGRAGPHRDAPSRRGRRSARQA
jgi:hypothetical protein